MDSKNSFILIPLFDCSIPETLCNINLKWCSRWCGIFCWILNEPEIHFYWYYSVKIDQNKAKQIKDSKKKIICWISTKNGICFLKVFISNSYIHYQIKSKVLRCSDGWYRVLGYHFNSFSFIKLIHFVGN